MKVTIYAALEAGKLFGGNQKWPMDGLVSVRDNYVMVHANLVKNESPLDVLAYLNSAFGCHLPENMLLVERAGFYSFSHHGAGAADKSAQQIFPGTLPVELGSSVLPGQNVTGFWVAVHLGQISLLNSLITLGYEDTGVELFLSAQLSNSQTAEDALKSMELNAALSRIKLLGLFDFRDLIMRYRAGAERLFRLEGKLLVSLFGADYTFAGLLEITEQYARGKLSTIDPSASIDQPFDGRMRGVRFSGLEFQVIHTFAREDQPSSTGLWLKGTVEYANLSLTGMLLLSGAKPVLGQLVLNRDLSIAALFEASIPGMSWPSDLINLEFAQGSCIYYLAESESALPAIPQEERPAGKLTYEKGFHIHATMTLTLFSPFTIEGDIAILEGGVSASICLGQALDLYILQLGGIEDNPGPAFTLSTVGKTTSMGFSGKLSFFKLEVGDITLSCGKEKQGGGLKVSGTFTLPRSVAEAIPGKDSLSFTYSKQRGLEFPDWKEFSFASEVLDIVKEMKELVNSTGKDSCGKLAGELMEKVIQTRFQFHPSFETAESGSLELTLSGSYTLSSAGYDIVSIDLKNLIRITLPKNLSWDELGQSILEMLQSTAVSLVQGLLDNETALATVLGIAAGKEAAKCAATMVCRQLVKASLQSAAQAAGQATSAAKGAGGGGSSAGGSSAGGGAAAGGAAAGGAAGGGAAAGGSGWGIGAGAAAAAAAAAEAAAGGGSGERPGDMPPPMPQGVAYTICTREEGGAKLRVTWTASEKAHHYLAKLYIEPTETGVATQVPIAAMGLWAEYVLDRACRPISVGVSAASEKNSFSQEQMVRIIPPSPLEAPKIKKGGQSVLILTWTPLDGDFTYTVRVQREGQEAAIPAQPGQCQVDLGALSFPTWGVFTFSIVAQHPLDAFCAVSPQAKWDGGKKPLSPEEREAIEREWTQASLAERQAQREFLARQADHQAASVRVSLRAANAVLKTLLGRREELTQQKAALDTQLEASERALKQLNAELEAVWAFGPPMTKPLADSSALLKQKIEDTTEKQKQLNQQRTELEHHLAQVEEQLKQIQPESKLLEVMLQDVTERLNRAQETLSQAQAACKEWREKAQSAGIKLPDTPAATWLDDGPYARFLIHGPGDAAFYSGRFTYRDEHGVTWLTMMQRGRFVRHRDGNLLVAPEYVSTITYPTHEAGGVIVESAFQNGEFVHRYRDGSGAEIQTGLPARSDRLCVFGEPGNCQVQFTGFGHQRHYYHRSGSDWHSSEFLAVKGENGKLCGLSLLDNMLSSSTSNGLSFCATVLNGQGMWYCNPLGDGFYLADQDGSAKWTRSLIYYTWNALQFESTPLDMCEPWMLDHVSTAEGKTDQSRAIRFLDWERKPVEAVLYQGELFVRSGFEHRRTVPLQYLDEKGAPCLCAFFDGVFHTARRESLSQVSRKPKLTHLNWEGKPEETQLADYLAL